MKFEIVSDISQIETIAEGNSIRVLSSLNKRYGRGRWRKLKGIGSLGWAVVADTSPKQIAGLSGGLFNTFGNTAAITTPIVIGYIVQGTGSFNGALVFVAANALIAIVSYLFVVGEIKRVELQEL